MILQRGSLYRWFLWYTRIYNNQYNSGVFEIRSAKDKWKITCGLFVQYRNQRCVVFFFFFLNTRIYRVHQSLEVSRLSIYSLSRCPKKKKIVTTRLTQINISQVESNRSHFFFQFSQSRRVPFQCVQGFSSTRCCTGVRPYHGVSCKEVTVIIRHNGEHVQNYEER